MITKDSTKEEVDVEIEKCRNSPAYYYNTYFRQSNSPHLTDEDFENIQWGLVHTRLKPRRPLSLEQLKEMFNNNLPDWF